jgi:peptidoglycan/xylan/chitin deacetylase (PgdA/CDA1 family)
MSAAALPLVLVFAGGARAGAIPPGSVRAGARVIALTFDAAWSDGGAMEILDTLRDRGIRATFFIAGRFVADHPDLVRRIAADEHEVGNHTFHHDHLTRDTGPAGHVTRPGLTSSTLRDELDRTANAYRSLTGRSLDPLWRAPYGETNDEILAWGREAGYAYVPWSEGLDALDWVSDPASSLYQSPAQAVERLLARLRDRPPSQGPAIVLMHLGSTRPAGARFADALPRLIDGAILLGYRFETAGTATREGDRP